MSSANRRPDALLPMPTATSVMPAASRSSKYGIMPLANSKESKSAKCVRRSATTFCFGSAGSASESVTALLSSAASHGTTGDDKRMSSAVVAVVVAVAEVPVVGDGEDDDASVLILSLLLVWPP